MYTENLSLVTVGQYFRASFLFDIIEDEGMLFPSSIAHILHKTHTNYLRLRFSQGHYDESLYGILPENGTLSGGTGVELFATIDLTPEEQDFYNSNLNNNNIKNNNNSLLKARWRKLVNALSGLFCASLNYMDDSLTTSPKYMFNLPNDYYNEKNISFHSLYSALPREPICTENLTPFLKLLPCKGHAGIASLLDGHTLFDSQWQSMAIDVYPTKDPLTNKTSLRLRESIDIIFSIPRSEQRTFSGIPEPIPYHLLDCNTSKPYFMQDLTNCFPNFSPNSYDVDLSLPLLFKNSISGKCPLADHSSIDLSASGEANNWNISAVSSSGGDDHNVESLIEPQSIVYSHELNSTTYHFPINIPESTFNLHIKGKSTPTSSQPIIIAKRSLTGHGQARGGIRTVFINPSSTDGLKVVLFELLPWYMRVFLHTLKACLQTDLDLDSTSLLSSSFLNLSSSFNTTCIDLFSSPILGLNSPNNQSIIQDIYYLPAIDRKRPTHVEITYYIPPKSTLITSYSFDRALLYYSEYPPDANRGFDVAPAVVYAQTVPFAKNSSSFIEKSSIIHLSSILLSLPTPDFSMPYNVIILTSTVLALIFGWIFNTITGKFQILSNDTNTKSDNSLIQKLLMKLRIKK